MLSDPVRGEIVVVLTRVHGTIPPEFGFIVEFIDRKSFFSYYSYLNPPMRYETNKTD
jgi:hypothetical protein